MNPAATPYDEILYPSAIYSYTHPDRLATMGSLFGIQPAAVERCRVLELGCGDGTNLIAMALGLPDSRFVGIDLAGAAIANGRAVVEELRLGNVVLQQLDVMKLPRDLGRFDFIIAHGLYSWVPDEVRDKILEVCDQHLTDGGVAFVSYNAYPGNHLRDLARRMMLYHVAPFREPLERIQQARALLKFVAESKPEPAVYHQVLQRELERVAKYTDAGFFHDDLSSINHPVYFHELAEHAARHGLQYLAEAEPKELRDEDYPPHVAAVLGELQRGNVIAREQYLDFLKGRAFRCTLLCRAGLRLDRTLNPERVHGLYASAEAEPLSESPDLRSTSSVVFRGPKGVEVETTAPLVKAALIHLGKAWPRHIHFAELLEIVRRRLAGVEAEQSGAEQRDEARDLGEALLRGCLAGLVELHAHAPAFVTEVSERPVASALARVQLRRGDPVATLRHTTLKIEDSLSRHLVGLLDGTRDRSALVRELAELVESGDASLPRDGAPVVDARQALSEGLDENLKSLARSAVLVG